MSKKHYPRQNNRPYSVPVQEQPVETVEVEAEETPVQEAAVEPVETEKVQTLKQGVVTDCVKLNVREEPKAGAKVVCTIDFLTEVTVDVESSTDDFYCISTASGIEGYCMKDYISI